MFHFMSNIFEINVEWIVAYRATHMTYKEFVTDRASWQANKQTNKQKSSPNEKSIQEINNVLSTVQFVHL